MNNRVKPMQILRSFKDWLVHLVGEERSKPLHRLREYVAYWIAETVPVLVYQMGKVGSVSVYRALVDADYFPVFHFHYMDHLKRNRRLEYRYTLNGLNLNF
jgi:hypothetical protein